MPEHSAIVVGGGIGGLATAHGLIRAGWSVTVLERAPEFTEVGAGISLWSNAFQALDTLGLGDAVRALGARQVGGTIRDHRGGRLLRNDVAAHAVLLHRAELLGVLLDAVPPEHLSAGTTVRAVRPAGAKVIVEHSRGESTVDVVVGADGLRSTVRGQLWQGAQPPRYTGHTSWRMILPATGDLPAGETWGPGALFGVVPMSAGRVYCFGSATVPAGQTSPDGEVAELRRRFGRWHDPIPSLLEAATDELVLRHDLYYLPPLDSFARDRVALVGDAAHAMAPNLGQGACQALEDAATLTDVLSTQSTVDEALREYDHRRRRRAQTVASRSRMAGRTAQLRNPAAVAIRNAALRLVPPSVFARSVRSVVSWTAPRVAP